MKRITIVGGGSSAHVLAPFFSSLNYEVTVLTRRPEVWKQKVSVEFQDEFGKLKRQVKGTLKKITSDTAEAVNRADIIILCLPVAKYFNMLMRIAEHLDKDREVFIGMLYGQGAVDLMFEEVKNKFNLKNMVYFSYGLIPFICRTKKYGEIGITYGAKTNNVVAVNPKEKFNELEEIFLSKVCYYFFNDEKVHQSDNFISLTLSASNQLIHISRMYGLYFKNKDGWEKEEDVPYFYKDYDEYSAKIFEDLDEDYEKIREKIRKMYPNEDFKYMTRYLELVNFSYGFSNKNIQESFTTSKTLNQIKTPIMLEDDRYVLDKKSRFFTDDIFYGLAIAKWFAIEYDIEVPTIDTLLKWTEEYLGITILKDGHLNEHCVYNHIEIGIPPKYKTFSKDNLIK
ncbi:NAD/NADP octopine/nopaline dehydrogenase family protein [Fusobacterium sp. MFO224]|uniref:NAD/NADP octopine/nopaline dehydrogenase family protein n=1 Tax=Fusobacterium sp. MFO224 TaxID=3378070 RepID=UPI003851B82E